MNGFSAFDMKQNYFFLAIEAKGDGGLTPGCELSRYIMLQYAMRKSREITVGTSRSLC